MDVTVENTPMGDIMVFIKVEKPKMVFVTLEATRPRSKKNPLEYKHDDPKKYVFTTSVLAVCATP